MISRQRAIPVVSAEIQKKSDAKGAKNDNNEKNDCNGSVPVCCCARRCCVRRCRPRRPRPSTGFSDVPATHWAADSIRRAVDLGLFQGQTATRFGLGAPMTRGAFVTALCRLFGWEMVTPETGSYADNQDKTAWYYSAVETAYANGAITHQTDTFRPRDPITREELAVMLVRAMGYGTIAGLAQDLPIPFQDVTTNTGYVAMAYETGSGERHQCHRLLPGPDRHPGAGGSDA